MARVRVGGVELLAPRALDTQREGGAAHGVGGRLRLQHHRAVEPGTLVEGADVHGRHLQVGDEGEGEGEG